MWFENLIYNHQGPLVMKPGIYNIYKPPGPTSHDLVNRIRKISGEKRVGHAGTLDPFAEGVLIVAVGREHTKKLGQFLKADKTYRATLRLGAISDTYDRTGDIKSVANTAQEVAVSCAIARSASCIIAKHSEPNPQLTASRFSRRENRRTDGQYSRSLIPNRRTVTEALKKFKGEMEQIPPAFSAIRVKGKRAYALARRGLAPDLKPRRVKIYSLKILKYRWPYLEIETKVSSGTYIRSLAHDLGQALGTGAYVEKLFRTKIGEFTSKKSQRI